MFIFSPSLTSSFAQVKTVETYTVWAPPQPRAQPKSMKNGSVHWTYTQLVQQRKLFRKISSQKRVTSSEAITQKFPQPITEKLVIFG